MDKKILLKQREKIDMQDKKFKVVANYINVTTLQFKKQNKFLWIYWNLLKIILEYEVVRNGDDSKWTN